MAQRQLSNSDTDRWNDKFGDGSDGALTISTNTTHSPVDASCSGTSGTKTLSATNASFAGGDLLFIHQTRGTGEGSWELNKIDSYVAGTITTVYDLVGTYTDSGDSQAQVIVMPAYSAVTVNGGVTYTVKTWDDNVGGIMPIFCNGTITITGNIDSDGNAGSDGDPGAIGDGIGFDGGVGGQNNNGGTQGDGDAGTGSVSTSANGSGGGGGDADGGGGGGGGGGNASSGGNGGTEGSGTGGTGGSDTGTANLTTASLGGGGGGGGSNSSTVGSGGAGAGFVALFGRTITVTGDISGEGGNGASFGGASGGAGAGASILLKGDNVTVGTNLVTAQGGTGGGSTGGNGSDGRIAIYYGTSVSGTTNPAANETQDGALTFGGNRGYII